MSPSSASFGGLRMARTRSAWSRIMTPLARAEPYGDCLTHAAGHHEVWECWRRLGPTGLARRGLPAADCLARIRALPTWPGGVRHRNRAASPSTPTGSCRPRPW